MASNDQLSGLSKANEQSSSSSKANEQLNYLNNKLKQQGDQIVYLQNLITNLQNQTKALASAPQSSSTTTIQDASLKEKLPPLEKFKGNRQMWDEWHLGAIHKLTKDGPAIGDGYDKFMFIYAALDGEAVKMVSTTAKILSETKTGDGLSFLAYLNSVFGDPNKKARAQQQLYNLKQKEREPFAAFLPKFETILATAGWASYADDQKISLLKNALSKEIRATLIGRTLPEKWSEFISLILTISSEIVALNQQFLSPVAYQPKQKHQQPGFSSMDWEPVKSLVAGTRQRESVKHASWVKKETLEFRKKKGLCVRCGNKGHIAPNCQFLPPLRPNTHVNTSRTSVEEEEVKLLAQPDLIEDIESSEGKDVLLC